MDVETAYRVHLLRPFGASDDDIGDGDYSHLASALLLVESGLISELASS